MTKEELEKEAEEWLCNNLHSASEEDFIKAMVDIAEPKEKRIAELEKEKCELLGIIQGKDKVIKELQDKLNELLELTLSYVECCDVCPETKTCHNSEGVCPYAEILQQDEDKVTQDWLLEYLNKKE